MWGEEEEDEDEEKDEEDEDEEEKDEEALPSKIWQKSQARTRASAPPVTSTAESSVKARVETCL